MSTLIDNVYRKIESIEADLCSETISPDEAQLILSKLEALRVYVIQKCSIEEIAINIMVNNHE